MSHGMAFDRDQHDFFIIKLEKYILDKTAVQKVENKIVQNLFFTERSLNRFSHMSYILNSLLFSL